MLYHSSIELIGNTPLVELSRIKIPNQNRIFAKLESQNPAGGIKDRVAFQILSKLRREGALNENSVIIEPTAGNMGLGIAFVALHFGLRVQLVVPEKFSIEKQTLMRSLGAEVINTPKDEGMQGAIAKAKELLDANPNALTLNQFENPENPKTHYENTAREIYADLPGLDFFVCGAGSGGSFSGIVKFLKEQNEKIQAVLCDPVGSIIGGGTGGCMNIEGIGNNFIPNTMNLKLIDSVEKISDEEAYEGLRMAIKNEGLLVGISSGACLRACLKLAERVEKSTIVTLFADDFSRYLSKEIL
ncbi:cysteine synthase family protein [Campylobacter sp.]|uniref:PLP-dependent cysteine synthase family protein n=1 Tax=Campylobacter sp. TaxID=205 RepID=UPI0026DCBC32|nr:cysteine synthase family protein [Campylobacter sp.]MDO4674346.1 cysteine synthase family protein [Campylobacter sp.]